MDQRYKPQEEKEEEDSFDAGFKIPETRSVLNSIGQSLAVTHTQLREEEEKQGKDQDRKKQQRRGGAICCCGVEHCGIGPFVERA